MVNVAQLVEHQIVALVAEGSSPSIHPKKNLASSTKKFYITLHTHFKF